MQVQNIILSPSEIEFLNERKRVLTKQSYSEMQSGNAASAIQLMKSQINISDWIMLDTLNKHFTRPNNGK